MNKERKRNIIIAAVLIAVTTIINIYCLNRNRDRLPVPAGKPVFDGDSRNLKTTKVVPALDASIDGQTNALWCASFLAAWKTLETDVAKEPPTLQGSAEVVLSLNSASDPRPGIPEKNLYTAAGWNPDGITDRIIKDLARKFPAKTPPDFPGISPDSFVAYAYLEANIRFSRPYFQNRKPLVFTDREGGKSEVSSFGIRPEDEHAFLKLRKQPRILYQTWNKKYEITECIIDLDYTSKPNQIILSLTDQEPTLADMLATVKKNIETAEKKKEQRDFGSADVLLVPDMVWRVTHHFAELEGREFANEKLKGQRIDVARQDIQFRLDRNGAELKSEAKMYMKSGGMNYVFNRPFLLQMKKRGAEMPYFVMWVANAELLNKWQPVIKSQ